MSSSTKTAAVSSAAKDRLEGIVKNLKDAFVAYQNAIRPALLPAGDLDPKTAAMLAAAKNFDSNYQNGVLALITALTGEDVSEKFKKYKDSGVTRIPLGMVVPTANPNGHNYPVGTPMMLLPDLNQALRVDGRMGNAYQPNGANFRLPTEAETRAFLDSFFNAAWTSLPADIQQSVLKGLDPASEAPPAPVAAAA
jgi:hypothetical protein